MSVKPFLLFFILRILFIIRTILQFIEILLAPKMCFWGFTIENICIPPVRVGSPTGYSEINQTMLPYMVNIGR